MTHSFKKILQLLGGYHLGYEMQHSTCTQAVQMLELSRERLKKTESQFIIFHQEKEWLIKLGPF